MRRPADEFRSAIFGNGLVLASLRSDMMYSVSSKCKHLNIFIQMFCTLLLQCREFVAWHQAEIVTEKQFKINFCFILCKATAWFYVNEYTSTSIMTLRHGMTKSEQNFGFSISCTSQFYFWSIQIKFVHNWMQRYYEMSFDS